MASSVIGALRVNLGIDSAAFSNGLKASQSNLKKFGAIAKVGLAAAATAAVGLAYSLKGTVMAAADAADSMSKSASKFGIPIQEFSRLKHAADLSGVSMGTVASAMKFMARKDPNMTLETVADQLAKLPPGAERAALAMKLMGRAGVELIPMLSGGAAELQKLKAEADALGLVFTPEMGEASERFNDNMDRLGKVLSGIGNQVAIALMPHLAALTDWLIANAVNIVSAARGFVDMSIAVGKAIAAIVGFVQSAGSAFAEFDRAILSTRASVIAVFAGMAEAATTGVSGVIAAFVNLKDQAIAAVSGMVTGIGEWMTGRLNAIWDGVIAKVQAVGDKIRWLYDSAVGNSWIPDLVTESEGWFDRLGSSFGTTIAGLVKGTTTWREALAGLLQSMAGMFSGNNFGAGSGFFGNLLGGMFGGGGGGMSMAPAMSGVAGGGGELVVRTEPSPLFQTVVESRVQSGLSRAPGIMADRQARGIR